MALETLICFCFGLVCQLLPRAGSTGRSTWACSARQVLCHTALIGCAGFNCELPVPKHATAICSRSTNVPILGAPPTLQPNAEPLVLERVPTDTEARQGGPAAWIHTKVRVCELTF